MPKLKADQKNQPSFSTAQKGDTFTLQSGRQRLWATACRGMPSPKTSTPTSKPGKRKQDASLTAHPSFSTNKLTAASWCWRFLTWRKASSIYLRFAQAAHFSCKKLELLLSRGFLPEGRRLASLCVSPEWPPPRVGRISRRHPQSPC